VINTKTGKQLKGALHLGYPRFHLKYPDKVRSVLGHRMVAQTFIPNPDNLAEVNHIDGNRGNCVLENLEWVSRSGNQKHAFDTGLNSNKGVKNGKAIVDEKIAVEIYNMMLSGKTPTQVAKHFNVSTSLVGKIRSKVNWAEHLEHLPEIPPMTLPNDKRTTPEVQQRIIELKKEGLSAKAIVELLELHSINQVESAVTKYNRSLKSSETMAQASTP
jgi:hypothetical protein